MRRLPRVCGSIWLVLVALDLFGAAQEKCLAEDPVEHRLTRSDGHALSRIFADEFLIENAEEIRRRAADLDATERYRLLHEWVLPAASHDTLRLTGSFTPYGPVPPLLDEHPHEFAGLDDAPKRKERRVEIGGDLVSAVYDLLETAEELRRLPQLRSEVAECPVEGDPQERCRMALLALIDIALGDHERALAGFDELHRRIREQPYAEMRNRWPETLLLNRMLEHPELNRAAEPLLYEILNRQVRAGYCNGPTEWDRQIAAFVGRLLYNRHASADRGATQALYAPPALEYWAPVSGGDFATHALGCPPAHWHWNGEFVHKLTSHWHEYLYFRSPLRGEFQIECDATAFDWKDCHPMVGGTWVAPVHNHQAYEHGTLRGVEAKVALDPPLSQVNEWMRYRIVSKDGDCSIFLNGRLLHQQRLDETDYPWFAIRSPFYGVGQVRDVRITGQPEIPEQISLSSEDTLSGWVAYLRDSVGGKTDDWRFDPRLGPQGGIFARRKAEYAGTFQESLLQYHRPMLEDGVIEYEFFHDRETHVHPAIGRKAFLLHPEGVRIHWITNGHLDRSGLDPLNSIAVDESAQLPLVDGWNRLRLQVSGDRLRIVLNRQPVYEGTLHATSGRTFGLFHYADQTEVRVRNMLWRGEWPKRLPPLAKQELRGTQTDQLDAERDRLTEVFEHDFEQAGYSPVDFFRRSSDGSGTVELRPNGLRMERASTQKFNDIAVGPRLAVRGDFDIEASFEDLELQAPQDGDTSIYLIVVVDDQFYPHGRVRHGLIQPQNSHPRRISEGEFNWYRPERVQIEYAGRTAEACNAGRLRLARRGKRLHVLVAEEDSSAYRLLTSREFHDQPLVSGGVRLTAGCYSADGSRGSVSVIWKRLTVHADEILGATPAMEKAVRRKEPQ